MASAAGHIPPMIDRRTALLTGLTFAATAGPARAELTVKDRADLTRVEAYLNSIRTLRAKFTQIAQDGEIAHGKA